MTSYTFEYENAQYFDGGTGIDRETVFKTLFVDDEPGFHASVKEELNALKELVEVPETITISSVEVREDEDTENTVNLFVNTPDVTTGTQPKRQKHSELVFRGDTYSLTV